MYEILAIQVTEGRTLFPVTADTLAETLEDLTCDPNYEVVCVLKDKVEMKEKEVKELIENVSKKQEEIPLTSGQEHIATLKKLLKEAEHGDEHGIRPDITDSEVKAIEWAIQNLEK